MVEKLKDYIERLYKEAEKYSETYRDIENWRGQAFGALMFCIEKDLVEYKEVENYWNIMWHKFNHLNYRKK